VVVNEVTWQDQQYIETLNHQLRQYHAKNPDTTRLKSLIVVHNFKNTTTIEQFESHRKEYVEKCYVGHLKTRKVGDGGEATYYENSQGDIIHFFLAREPHTVKEESPAGALHNKATIAQLKGIIKAMVGQERPGVLERVCALSLDSLGTFFHVVQDVGIFWEDGVLKLKARGPTRGKDGTPLNNPGSIRLLNIDIKYDSTGLQLVSANDFEMEVDVLKTDIGMMVLADLPIPSSKSGLPVPSKINVEYDSYEHDLILKGHRTLYYRTHIKPSHVSEVCKSYERGDEFIERLERSAGAIERRIPIPRGYTFDPSAVHLDHGQLQILLPNEGPAPHVVTV